MHLVLVYLGVFGGMIVYRFYDSKRDDLLRDKYGKYPSIQYFFISYQCYSFTNQLHNGNRNNYDNILAKYVSDPFGSLDQPFEEY